MTVILIFADDFMGCVFVVYADSIFKHKVLYVSSAVKSDFEL